MNKRLKEQLLILECIAACRAELRAANARKAGNIEMSEIYTRLVTVQAQLKPAFIARKLKKEAA